MQENKTVSLVLGSGGARGLAHIGVIRWLEQHGYQIKSISGCSIGALVGGAYAAGKLEEFETWVRAINKVDILNLLDFSWRTSGLVKGDRIINTLTGLVGDIDIDDLAIKYTAVAADIVHEKEVWMNSGPLFDAIRASISLPLFFTPFCYQGVDLIDGGVLNPVPIAPTFGDNTDLTIAVNLGGSPLHQPTDTSAVKACYSANASQQKDDTLSTVISEFVSSVIGRDNRLVEPSSSDWDAYDVANQSFDAMQGTIARQKLAAYPPDYFIEIARNACGTLEFDRADEMIALGYHKAQQSLSFLHQG